MTKPSNPPAPELGRPIDITDSTRLPRELHIEASASERAAIARRLGIAAVDELAGDVVVSRWRGSGIAVQGEFYAAVTQTCVLTLEAFTNRVQDQLTVRLLPMCDRPETDRGLEDMSLEDMSLEDIELLEGDVIDVGELIVQHLAVAMDPYPRMPGAALSLEEVPEGADRLIRLNEDTSRASSPFGDLERLKKGAKS